MKNSRDSLFKWICDKITGIGKTNTAVGDDTKNRHKRIADKIEVNGHNKWIIMTFTDDMQQKGLHTLKLHVLKIP